MSRLDDAAKSVPAGSAPAADDPGLDTHDDDRVDDPALEGDPSTDDDPDGNDGKDGRSIENVRGELLRKMEKQNEALMAELRALREANQYRPEPKPDSSKPKTLDDMSVAELEQMKDSIPEDKRAAFGQYLIERKAAEIARNEVERYRKVDSFESAEKHANEKAFSRWPQLHNKSSEFYQVTNRILQEMGPDADNNPRAVLDAANEAGLELRLTPQTYGARIERREPGSVQGGRTSRPTKGRKDDVIDMESDEQRAIRDRLATAMPGKKFTKEQLARIAKRQKLYKDNLPLFTRG
jgi:hypothetical protein